MLQLTHTSNLVFALFLFTSLNDMSFLSYSYGDGQVTKLILISSMHCQQPALTPNA